MNREVNKKLLYITNLAKKSGGGGSYAVNWHTQEQLQKHFELVHADPIVPKVPSLARFVSRVQRYVLERPSNFFFFSPKTLESNATRASHYFKNADAVFFRSATSWSHCKPAAPYFVYLDAVFHTFFENTFDQKDFIASDLQRIFDAEARFLERATAVFFESGWGLQKARDAYLLMGNHYVIANRGGALEPPASDTWTGNPPILLSIAMRFEQKGGEVIFEAFKQLKTHHPDLRWHVIGGEPTGNWKSVDGIVYEGVLNPDHEQDLKRYRKLLSEAFLLLHPTREDTSPLVLTEAAYFGCPSISVNRFAIPELVIKGKTGILLDWPVRPSELVKAVHNLINSPEAYRQMRRAAFDFSRAESDWDRIGSRMAEVIAAALEDRGRQ